MKIYRSLSALRKVQQLKKADKIILVTSAILRKKLSSAIVDIKVATTLGLKIVTIPDGEKAKNWDALRKLLSRFVKIKLTKKNLVIVLGGGSASDLVGFACSIYERGVVPYINIPTTFLAQVDASMGGKTAIDFEGYKNLIGSFYDPLAVFILTDFLGSLNEEQFVEGLAEIIKAGFIRDPKILDILESCDVTKLRANHRLLEELILKAIAVKAYYVEKDHRDKNVRQFLNFGHTIGQAIELKYGISHGRAVLLGMLKEFQATELLGMKNLRAGIRFCRLLVHLGVNLNPQNFVVDRQSIFHDKKVFGKKIILPVVRKAGKAKLLKVRLDDLMVAIKKCN